jgi:hypothetical protein
LALTLGIIAVRAAVCVVLMGAKRRRGPAQPDCTILSTRAAFLDWSRFAVGGLLTFAWTLAADRLS